MYVTSAHGDSSDPQTPHSSVMLTCLYWQIWFTYAPAKKSWSVSFRYRADSPSIVELTPLTCDHILTHPATILTSLPGHGHIPWELSIVLSSMPGPQLPWSLFYAHSASVILHHHSACVVCNPNHHTSWSIVCQGHTQGHTPGRPVLKYKGLFLFLLRIDLLICFLSLQNQGSVDGAILPWVAAWLPYTFAVGCACWKDAETIFSVSVAPWKIGWSLSTTVSPAVLKAPLHPPFSPSPTQAALQYLKEDDHTFCLKNRLWGTRNATWFLHPLLKDPCLCPALSFPLTREYWSCLWSCPIGALLCRPYL